MEETISIKDLLKALRKRWMLIIILTLSAGVISAIISYYVLTPVYQASTQILVNKKGSDNLNLDSSQVQTNVDLINTYSVIIKSPVILEKVVKELNLKQSSEALNQQITVNSQENSQVFSLTVQDNDPANATKIVNTLSETFQKEIQSIMNVDNVTIISKASLKDNSNPVEPNSFMNIAIALIIGLIVSIGLSLLLEYMDNTIKDENYIGNELGLPVLGSIEKIPQNYEESFKKSSVTTRMGSETLES